MQPRAPSGAARRTATWPRARTSISAGAPQVGHAGSAGRPRATSTWLVRLHVHRAGAQLLLELGHRPRPLLEAPQAQLGAHLPALAHLGGAALPLQLERGGVAVVELGSSSARCGGAGAPPPPRCAPRRTPRAARARRRAAAPTARSHSRSRSAGQRLERRARALQPALAQPRRRAPRPSGRGPRGGARRAACGACAPLEHARRRRRPHHPLLLPRQSAPARDHRVERDAALVAHRAEARRAPGEAAHLAHRRQSVLGRARHAAPARCGG